MKTHATLISTDRGDFVLCEGDEAFCNAAADRLREILSELPAQKGTVRVSLPAEAIQTVFVRHID